MCVVLNWPGVFPRLAGDRELSVGVSLQLGPNSEQTSAAESRSNKHRLICRRSWSRYITIYKTHNNSIKALLLPHWVVTRELIRQMSCFLVHAAGSDVCLLNRGKTSFSNGVDRGRFFFMPSVDLHFCSHCSVTVRSPTVINVSLHLLLTLDALAAVSELLFYILSIFKKICFVPRLNTFPSVSEKRTNDEVWGRGPRSSYH